MEGARFRRAPQREDLLDGVEVGAGVVQSVKEQALLERGERQHVDQVRRCPFQAPLDVALRKVHEGQVGRGQSAAFDGREIGE
ncbi:hypothetical protein SCALM49S_06693 [Streptomyces californicus]